MGRRLAQVADELDAEIDRQAGIITRSEVVPASDVRLGLRRRGLPFDPVAGGIAILSDQNGCWCRGRDRASRSGNLASQVSGQASLVASFRSGIADGDGLARTRAYCAVSGDTSIPTIKSVTSSYHFRG